MDEQLITIPAQVVLSEQEYAFCDLFVNGGPDYAGRQHKCYSKVFGIKKGEINAAGTLIKRPHILAHIREMVTGEQYQIETTAIKLQLAETLKSIMEETSKSEYTDRFGIAVSPAPLRAVAVNAARALMDLYPVKNQQDAKLKIEGDGNVIFNVIVPNAESLPGYEKNKR